MVRQESMTRRLLTWREDVFADYEPATFEAELAARFAIRERTPVPGSERVLYRVEGGR